MIKQWIVFLAALLLLGCDRQQAPVEQGMDVSSLLSGSTAGFSQAINPRQFVFPKDHAGHHDFRNEWWYFTGNLQAQDGRRFGYQLTFFRNGLSVENSQEEDSAWRSDQVWMAHLAVSDISEKQHYSAERWARNGLDLAGVKDAPLEVWLENWTLKSAEDGGFPWQLQAEAEEFSIALTLQSGQKPPVLQGKQGLSQKGAGKGQASYYYSMMRLPSAGEITLGNQAIAVQGESWLDREWSTSVLSDNQQGWDWFALQLFDGRELMFYQLRLKDGLADTFSAGVLVNKGGTVIPLNNQSVQRKAVRHWQAEDGSQYPVEWQIKVSKEHIDWTIKATFEEQQMPLSVRYWEGAVDVLENNKNIGHGYLEMTGY